MSSPTLAELESYCNEMLNISAFQDYCPNGLQVEAMDPKAPVKKIVTGVTASQALIDVAIEQKADVLLVHHGYFWKGESSSLVGIKGCRIRDLMRNGISLIAYHLPLDAHPVIGNNAQLANLLKIETKGGLDSSEYPVGNWGELAAARTVADFAEDIRAALGREPLAIGDSARQIQSVAWCTGAAQSYIEKAAALGVDAFITGEISEPSVHLARELDVVFYAAGHHATERYGVKALGEHLSEAFNLDVVFVDIDNPV
ncbi:GTP cyclohydrolase 1 type 2 [BD1-7 clade bacterium]|uniref:GTP cyclohydrolase 1 type 2 homolog n=1 Tax=BD1-7 clade bacterium TaxID=2029982 RepID=A0A5S9N207_9GAMM|nr:GTP cyclohydrolase 1 type 2 [BD1-7 clade bacterium]